MVISNMYMNIEIENEMSNFSEALKPIFDFFLKCCETRETYSSLSMLRYRNLRTANNYAVMSSPSHLPGPTTRLCSRHWEYLLILLPGYLLGDNTTLTVPTTNYNNNGINSHHSAFYMY